MPENPPPSADQRSAPGAPRWVKVAGIVALVVVLAVVAMLLIGGGHGPGRHLGGGDAPTAVEGHTPPPGGH